MDKKPTAAIKDAITNRIKKIRSSLKENSFDAILLTAPENITYATNFQGSDSWALVAKRKTILLTDSRYSEQAQGECVNCQIYERKGSILALLTEILAKEKSIKILAVESSMSVALYTELEETIQEKLDTKLAIISGIVEKHRELKDDLEVENIVRAAKIAKRALANALKEIKIGISERQLAGLLDYQMSRLLATPSFETIVAFGANASRPHHSPSSKRLKKNDTILIDYGARYDGYCCDITRCFATGKVNNEYQNAYEALLKAQAAAIKEVSPKAKICQADAAAREVLTAAGLPTYGHSTGHGIGLKVHEAPAVYSANEQMFKSGQIITIEPGIYIEGKFGIRIEDDVLVTKDGRKILTRGKQSPKLQILLP